MIARLRTQLRHLIARFGADRQGVAAIEFALVLPVMLLVYVGSVEAGSLLSVDKRVQTVAGAMGDLVSRANGQVAACDLKDYFAAASATMMPYSTGTLGQIVTSVQVDADGTSAVVQWSRATGQDGAGTATVAHSVGSAYPLPASMLTISKGQSVIVSEAAYSYQPITSLIYNQTIALRRENFYLPRFGGSIVVNPTTTTGC